jgi:hypothetical protein
MIAGGRGTVNEKVAPDGLGLGGYGRGAGSGAIRASKSRIEASKSNIAQYQK